MPLVQDDLRNDSCTSMICKWKLNYYTDLIIAAK